MQERLILEPVKQKLIKAFGTATQLESHLRQLISTLQQKSPPIKGYAGGNLINLLRQLQIYKSYSNSQIDLSGRDFSGLTIWQAYLKDVNLKNTSFANANLNNSVFAETMSSIVSVRFSSDGKKFATGLMSGEIRLWRTSDTKQLRIYKDHTTWVWTLAFSPDNKTLASGSADHTIKLWNLETDECLHTLKEHTNKVYSVAFSPDSSLLASAGEDQTIKLWNAQTGLCQQTLSDHNGFVWSVTFQASTTSNITPLLASGSADNTIKLWDINTGKCLKTLNDHNSDVHSVAFSPDGQTLASGSADQTLRLWDVTTGQCRQILEGHSKKVYSVRFSPNGQLLVTTSATDLQNAYLWDSHTGKLLDKLPGHQGGITSVQFTPDGTYILTADATGNLRLWSAEQGGELPSLQLEGETEWATFLPGGILPQANQASRAGGQGTWQKWQPTKLAPLNTAVTQIAMTQTAVTQMVAVAANGQIRQWKILTEPLTSLENNAPTENGSSNSMLHLAAIQPQTTAAKLRDRLLAFWPGSEPVHQAAVSGFMQLPQAAMVNPFPSQPLLDSVTKSGLPDSRAALTGFALNTDGSLLAKADIEGGVSVYQTETEQAPRLLYRIENWRSLSQTTEPLSEVVPLRSSVKHSSANQPQVMAHNVPTAIRYLMFSLNGQQLLGVADDLTIRVWDARSGQEVTVLRGHSATIRDAHFSADGQWIISAGWDKTARIWNVSTGQEVKLLKHTDAVSSAKFSPDGQRVVTTSWDGSVKLWQVATGQAQMSLDQHQKSVLDAAFSPDGTQIVTASIDGTARLWDAASGKEQAVLKPTSANGQSEPIVRAFFSPDGQYVATLGQSGRVSLWAATWDMLLHLAQERSLRQLTPEECSRYLRLPPNQCPSLPL